MPNDVTYEGLSPKTGGIPVDTVIETEQQGTGEHRQVVKVGESELPAGGATEAKQDDVITELQLKADLTETQPVSLQGYAVGLETAPLPAVLAGLYITKIDTASATITYIGVAAPGTASSAAAWQLLRIDTGTLAADILYADGDTNFDNIFDNRASDSYS